LNGIVTIDSTMPTLLFEVTTCLGGLSALFFIDLISDTLDTEEYE
jgi:hypothetical protein